jgi:hypothetical protein
MPHPIGSIQECLWKIALADKKINEVNINVMKRKRVLRKVQIPLPALKNIFLETNIFVLIIEEKTINLDEIKRSLLKRKIFFLIHRKD